MFWNTGTYKEVVANKKIVSTMSFSNENGKTIPGSQVSVPGQWPNEITVIVRPRSEEHTSELQSHSDLVCRLLLEKKKKINKYLKSNNVYSNGRPKTSELWRRTERTDDAHIAGVNSDQRSRSNATLPSHLLCALAD